jgi:hypothetical protein
MRFLLRPAPTARLAGETPGPRSSCCTRRNCPESTYPAASWPCARPGPASLRPGGKPARGWLARAGWDRLPSPCSRVSPQVSRRRARLIGGAVRHPASQLPATIGRPTPAAWSAACARPAPPPVPASTGRPRPAWRPGPAAWRRPASSYCWRAARSAPAGPASSSAPRRPGRPLPAPWPLSRRCPGRRESLRRWRGAVQSEPPSRP